VFTIGVGTQTSKGLGEKSLLQTTFFGSVQLEANLTSAEKKNLNLRGCWPVQKIQKMLFFKL
jgi:hypothetical protein